MMITVLGKLHDTRQYLTSKEHNVLPDLDNWTPELNIAWIKKAIERGDDFLILNRSQFDGFFRKECKLLITLLEEHYDTV